MASRYLVTISGLTNLTLRVLSTPRPANSTPQPLIKTLLKLVLLLVIGLLGYNYFFGTEEEKYQSREIVDKAKDLGSEAWNLLRSEKEKLSDGKYDDALDRLDNLYRDLSQEAGKLGDSRLGEELRGLIERRDELAERLRDGSELNARERRRLEELSEDTEVLMHEMEEEGQPGAPY